MTREELEKTVIRFMDSHTTMTVACCINDKPWAAAVYYARQRFDLVFFSSPKSVHSRTFEQNPSAAAAIHGDYSRWQDIKGLQMEGRVEAIASTVALARATATYLRRYPFVREFFSDPATLTRTVAAKMSKVAMYMFRPVSVRYLDNQGGLGNRWKLTIADGLAVGDPVRDAGPTLSV